MTRTIGTGPAGGGGGGGAVDSVNGKTGVVVLTAADVGADPAGTAAGLVTAHELASPAHDVSQITDALDKTGDTMSGTLAMGAEDITGTGAVTAATFNGVALTTAGSGDLYLADDGTYKATPDSNLFALQYSDTGVRGLNAALRSGGDLFGNLSPGSGIGQPTVAGRIRAVSWRRTNTANAGFLRVSVIDTGRTERVFTLVPVAAATSNGITSGLDIECFDNEQISVIWDGSSSGTTTSPAASVFVEPS